MIYSGTLKNHIDWDVYFYGAYEKPELLLIRDLLDQKKNPVSLDIGANTGHHALFLSQYSSVVHAFEPYAQVRDVFKRRIMENAISNITIHPYGLGDRAQELDYYAPDSYNTGTGSFVGTRGNNRLLGKLEVKVADQYLPTLSLEKIDFIKIDVEGFELEVLKGLNATLKKYRPTVFMEFSSDTKKKLGTVENLYALLPDNYEILNIRGNRPFLFLFNRITCILEMFDFTLSTQNILLIPKQI